MQSRSHPQSPDLSDQGTHDAGDAQDEYLMQVLMRKPYISMSLSEKVSIFLKICECALETNKLRFVTKSKRLKP